MPDIEIKQSHLQTRNRYAPRKLRAVILAPTDETKQIELIEAFRVLDESAWDATNAKLYEAHVIPDIRRRNALAMLAGTIVRKCCAMQSKGEVVRMKEVKTWVIERHATWPREVRDILGTRFSVKSVQETVIGEYMAVAHLAAASLYLARRGGRREAWPPPHYGSD